jgi:hypothetical protein
MGINPPHGPPEVVAAFEDANAAYFWAELYCSEPRTVELRLAGLADTCRGSVAVVDTFTNNVITRYDSLITAGWTRAAAVSYLYADQDIRRDSLVVSDSVFSLELTPNAVVLLDLQGVQTIGMAAPVPAVEGPNLELVPAISRGRLRFDISCPRTTGINVSLLDAGGRVRRTISLRLAAGRHAIDWDGRDDVGRALASGVYYWRIRADGLSRSGRTIIAR